MNFNQFSKIRCDASKDDMAVKRPTWAVVATVDEPPALVQAFVAWHLSLGAQAVFLYFDRPDDPAIRLFAHLPQVIAVSCDTAHWLHVGKSRPRRHQVRQVRNARDAYTQTRADWLVHIDADEFIWPHQGVSDGLVSVDPNADCLAVPVAERIYVPNGAAKTVFDGAFRRPFRVPANVGRAIFGADYDLTYRGLTGHSQGKAFVRVERPLKMSIHRPKRSEADQEPTVAQGAVDQLELLHFEGLTRAYWVYKLLRMSHALLKHGGMLPSPHRQRQADAVLADMTRAEALHDRLKICDDTRQSLLRCHDLLLDVPFDLEDPLQTYFPGQSIDLSPGTIDRWLALEKSDVLQDLAGPGEDKI